MGEGFIKEAELTEGIRIASTEDIMAMKLEALTNRSSKKDFYDLGILFQQYSLQEGITFYKNKFPYNDHMGVLKNITNFEKADLQPDPKLLNCPTWEETKKIITGKFDNFFENL